MRIAIVDDLETERAQLKTRLARQPGPGGGAGGAAYLRPAALP